MCNEIPLTSEEKQFKMFLDHFQEFYKSVIDISENEYTDNFLKEKLKNSDFKMFSLDEICQSCTTFQEDGISFYPKTTDAIFCKKHENGNFYIYLVEFKGSKLCELTKKCDLVQIYYNLKEINKDYQYVFNNMINDLQHVLYKFSDSLFNSLVSKPIETVTIALPLIYEEYYKNNQNQEGIEYIDIKNFLANSKIVYRVVSKSEEDKSRFQQRGKNYRCSIVSPYCKKYADENREYALLHSYQSNLLTFHKRYEAAGILFDSDFVEDVSFDQFINDYLK